MPDHVNDLVIEDFHNKIFEIHESSLTHFSGIVQSFEHINTVQLGTQDGVYYGAGRMLDGTVVHKLSSVDTGHAFHTYEIDPSGKKGALLSSRATHMTPVSGHGTNWRQLALHLYGAPYM